MSPPLSQPHFDLALWRGPHAQRTPVSGLPSCKDDLYRQSCGITQPGKWGDAVGSKDTQTHDGEYFQETLAVDMKRLVCVFHCT